MRISSGSCYFSCYWYMKCRTQNTSSSTWSLATLKFKDLVGKWNCHIQLYYLECNWKKKTLEIQAEVLQLESRVNSQYEPLNNKKRLREEGSLSQWLTVAFLKRLVHSITLTSSFASKKHFPCSTCILVLHLNQQIPRPREKQKCSFLPTDVKNHKTSL